MKLLTKNLLRLTLLLLVTIVNVNCQQEDLEKEVVEQEANNSPYRMELVTKDHYNHNPEILNELCKLKAKKPDFLSREIYNSEYDFYVETDYAKYIESTDGSFHSYTFAVVEEDETNVKENLVISLQPDGTYSSQFVEYTFNDDDTYSFRYANVDLNELDYFARTGTATFTYDCVITMQMNCHSWMDDGSCDLWQYQIVDTSCSYHFFDAGLDYAGSGGTTNYSIIWIGGGSGGPDNATNNSTNTTVGSSYTEPLFTKPFMGFISGLEPEQQDFLNHIENFQLKLDLQNFFDVNGFNIESETIADGIIEAGLDGSLITPFPFVKYPSDLAEQYRQQYSVLTEYLESELPNLADDELIVSALQQYGSLNEQQIKDALKWGSDSSVTIRIIDMPCCWGAYGPQFGYDENTVLISTELANEMQNNSTISQDALNFFVAITILHEVTHLGDYLYNGDMYDGEEGFDFELYVTGTQQQDPADSEVVYQGYILKKQN